MRLKACTLSKYEISLYLTEPVTPVMQPSHDE